MLLTAGLLMVCVLVYSLILMPLTRGYLRSVMDRTNVTVMKLLSSNLTNWFSERLSEVDIFSRHPVIVQGDPEEIQTLLNKEVERRTDPLLLMFRADKKGDYTTNRLVNVGNISSRPYFAKVMAGETVISEPLVSKSTGRPVIVIAAPIWVRGAVDGLMAETVDLESFYNFFQSRINLNNFKDLMVVDETGKILVHSQSKAIFAENIRIPSAHISKEMVDHSLQLLKNTSGSFELQGPAPSQGGLVFFDTIQGTGGLKLILQTSLEESRSFLDSQQSSLILLSMFLIIFGFFLIWWFARSISQPIMVLREVFDRAAAGDLSVQAPELVQDEVGRAGRSFNIMMGTIRNLTYYDAVTSLPNRVYFDNALHRLTTQETTRQQKAAVGIISLDKFKNINDAHGSTLGDRVLKEMGQRILSAAGDQSFVARGSSAEYHVFFGNLLNRRNAISLMSTLLMEISKPFNIQSETLFLTASAGLCFYPQDSRDPDDLLINASIAKSSAKKSGGNTLKLFNESMRQSLSAQMHIEALLHRALEHKELTLHYQPQVDAQTRKLVGMEALLRWDNQELGSVPPAVFIPLAEESGLIVSIGDWVLKEACRQNNYWLEMGLPVVPVAVNVSAWQFDQADFLDKVENVLEETFMPRELLELEITESVAMGQVEDKIRRLQTLSDSGIKISIDDFGTGYSSLNYLKQFPIHTLKIDQSFVREVPEDRDSMAIVETVITMGRNFNMQIIAEGVETQAQYDFIQSGGCHKIQGYFISRPLPAKEMQSILEGKVLL